MYAIDFCQIDIHYIESEVNPIERITKRNMPSYERTNH